MNMNKVYFYIAALAVIIGGVWAMKPDAAQQQKMREAMQKRKAAANKAQAQNAASVPVLSASAPATK